MITYRRSPQHPRCAQWSDASWRSHLSSISGAPVCFALSARIVLPVLSLFLLLLRFSLILLTLLFASGSSFFISSDGGLERYKSNGTLIFIRQSMHHYCFVLVRRRSGKPVVTARRRYSIMNHPVRGTTEQATTDKANRGGSRRDRWLSGVGLRHERHVGRFGRKNPP